MPLPNPAAAFLEEGSDHMILRKPEYFDSFRCLAGACPDSCCHQWEVQVDAETAERYRALSGPLGEELRKALCSREGETFMTLREGKCPMWRSDGLCRIQAELGEEGLCRVCREFPRLHHDYGDFVELILEMSCPEAARWIFQDAGEWVEREIPGGGEAEYDRKDMALLLSSRKEAMALLNGSALPEEALAKLLLLGVRTQKRLDGGDGEEISMDGIPASAEPGSIREIAGFFRDLEILTPRWRELLDTASPGPMSGEVIPFDRYLVTRYWLQAVSDLDLYGRVKFMVVSSLLVSSLAGNFRDNAQLWSKEIENDPDNLDAILDGTYEYGGFADRKLLGLLLGKVEKPV